VTYVQQERLRAAAWKRTSPSLPDDARRPAPYMTKDGTTDGPPYDFCLPIEHARLSLLPEVRVQALALFEELGVPWHAGVEGGPSNHLLSSQVQCVNALGQMVSDPSRVKRAFGQIFDIAEVLQIEPGRFLTFEYIGPTDVFGEAPGGLRTRGARCTSVDAAFLYRAADGVVELVLVEWKYTEAYRLRHPEPERDAERRRRYEQAVLDPVGPVHGDLLPFELLLDEPFYQLVRQQLLAHALEQSAAEGADRVRVLHVLDPANDGYQHSLHRPEHRALGATVSEVWQRLMRHPDRFTSVNPAMFLHPDITSVDYVCRYAPDLVYDEVALIRALGLDTAADVEDWLYVHCDYDHDVVCRSDEVELVVGQQGTSLVYPFRVSDLIALARELSEED
jgi:hypothetical protein